MKILNLIQGSKEWLEVRKLHFTASEAPMMMGVSRHATRTDLLSSKKGWVTKVDSFVLSLFEKGHKAEADALPITNDQLFEDFKPTVGAIDVDGIPYLASFDGLNSEIDDAWEHKLYNKILASNVFNGVLDDEYVYQLEHQMLVAGINEILFTCSDGTLENRETMRYVSLPEKRKKLIDGWKQFAIDLKNHEIKAKKEIVVAREPESFPLIKCSVEGSLVVSNLGGYIPAIKQLADEQMSLILETDQDFADKEAFNKNVKLGRATLKTQAADIEKKFESLAEFNGFVGQADKILQQLQSHGEKQVKQAKEAKKVSIVNVAQAEFSKHLAKLSESINGVQITQIVVDFEAVMKGKRSFEKMEEAVSSELANAKIEANDISQIIRKNLDSLEELAKDHRFLFSDHAMLLLKDNDDLVNLIKARISEHEEAEAERKQIEKEEVERKAKEKAEREAKAELERKEKVIRDEERKKVQAEEGEKRAIEAEKKPSEEPEEMIVHKETLQEEISESFLPEEMPEEQPQTTVDECNKKDEECIKGFLEWCSSNKEAIVDFGYLLISDDSRHHDEALDNINNKFSNYMNN